MADQTPDIVVMDYPTAWAYIRDNHPEPEKHHPQCSWVGTNAAMLCDCRVLWDEYDRRKATKA